MEWYGYVLLVAGLLIVAFIFFLIGMLYRKKVAEREIGSAETEATRIINEAIKGGENKKREMLVEAKEEIHKSRTEYEKEVKERRADLQKQERASSRRKSLSTRSSTPSNARKTISAAVRQTLPPRRTRSK